MENQEEKGHHHHGHSDEDDSVVLSVKEVHDSDDQILVAKGLMKPSGSSSRVRDARPSRIKHFSQELKRFASLGRRPQPPDRSDRTRGTAVAHAINGLKFISETKAGSTWAEVERRFDKLTRETEGLLPRSHFGELIGMTEDLSKNKKGTNDQWSEKFAALLLDALERRWHITREDSITKEQMRMYWDQISDQSFDGRLLTFIDMVDKDADGRISEDEIKEIIALSASANKLPRIQAGEYEKGIMEELDPHNFGYIMIEDLRTLLLRGHVETAGERGESGLLSRLLSLKLKPTQDHYMKMRYRDLRYFLIDNWQRVWVMALWIGAMAALFAYKYVQYRNKYVFEVMGHCVCMAKGAAETLKLNMALILLPVCRNTITWLQNKTRLGVAVPFADNLRFHQAIAIAVGLGVGIHGISHLACDFPRILNASPEKYEPMKPYFGEVQPTSYWQFVKGWEGITGIIMVVLMAIAFTLASPWFRRNKVKLPEPLNKRIPLNKLIGFNSFWYSHHLFIIVYTLLIIHGIKLYLTHEWYNKTTWMYLVVPVTLYAVERLVRLVRSRVKAINEYKVIGYPKSLALHMPKPDGFKYKSGQYIFVKCAAVSPFEWHPFSITSAPSDDYLSVHIRGLGDWTKQLRTVFEEACQQPQTEKSGKVESDHFQGENNTKFPRVLIDGPYGAPTQDYKDYEVVLLVGLGIGATPMISVVKDIINNIKRRDEEENTIEEGRTSVPRWETGSGSGRNDFKTRRAYFYWMTGEQDSFDWFKDVMNEVAEMDHKGVIELHNHCTSVYEQGDVRSALITTLQSINHAKNGVDIVSGTRVKSHFARPDWRKVYKKITLEHPHERVGVFYCGLPAPVKVLRQLASEFSHKTNTTFEFHKENF